MKPQKILFVCLGNICRSPLAEASFWHHVTKQGLEHLFYVESAGTANYHVGQTPDSRTIRNAKKHGIDIQHLGQQFVVADFDRFDHILVMDNSNLRNVLSLASEQYQKEKVCLLRRFDSENYESDVPDPWYGDEVDFENVFHIIHRCTENFLNHLLVSTKKE